MILEWHFQNSEQFHWDCPLESSHFRSLSGNLSVYGCLPCSSQNCIHLFFPFVVTVALKKQLIMLLKENSGYPYVLPPNFPLSPKYRGFWVVF